MRIVAIDPGVEGALACMDADGAIVDVDDLDIIQHGKLKWVDGSALLGKLIELRACRHHIVVVVEEVSPNPINSRRATKSQGLTLGSILATAQCAGVRVELVPPQTWKADMRLTGRKLNARQKKSLSLDRARLLWPDVELHLAKHHNRAEALLLAEWYRTHQLREAA